MDLKLQGGQIKTASRNQGVRADAKIVDACKQEGGEKIAGVSSDEILSYHHFFDIDIL